MLLVLLACSSAPKPKIAELPPNPAIVQLKPLWSANLPAIRFSLQPKLVDQQLALATSDGTLALLNAATGKELWTFKTGTPLTAGLGFDGEHLAVLTTNNELTVVRQGKQLWRQRLNSHTLTPPLVAGMRVFVVGGDRTVWAFDVLTGRMLWQQTRRGEALVLRQPGLLMAVNDTLVVGFSGRMAGLNPNTGALRWEASVAAPRGTNDVERLVDLVSPASRDDDVVCARAFQAAIGCVQAARGSLIWSKSSSGALGLSGNASQLFSVEQDGTLQAWSRASGDKQWSVNWLRARQSVAPMFARGMVFVGDAAGQLHVFAAADGKLLGRTLIDPAGLAMAPLTLGNSLLTVAVSGKVQAWALPD
jgi:outer membrane assembly lipoprotein YfgL